MNRTVNYVASMLTVFLLAYSWGSAYAETIKADRVMVSKGEKRLYLLKGEETIASFPVVFGGDPEGHKVQEGDQKTPEGSYLLDYKNPNSAYYKSIHVSYPNKQDRAVARELGVSPGGDIMIHGQPNGWGWASPVLQLTSWTDGCIALSNGDMDEVWAAVEPGTPIFISPN
ncbi:MAG: L,D-transpeptidase family protein [bacterium]